MSTTITIEQLRQVAREGRLAVRAEKIFGQTGAGAHTFSTRESVGSLEDTPTGVALLRWQGGTVPVPAGATIYHDPRSGLVWWGSTVTARILEDAEADLHWDQESRDRDNLAYQRALLRGEA